VTFTYSGTSLTTDLAKVRLAIGDTDSTAGCGVKPDNTNFTDEELNVYIAATGSWQGAVPQVMRALANMYATHARRITIGPISEEMAGIAAELREQAKTWETANPSVWSGLISFHGTDNAGQPIGHMFGKTQWGAKPEDVDD
jgi:ABC-type proline/glycine betaine transport system substrate-binding protein